MNEKILRNPKDQKAVDDFRKRLLLLLGSHLVQLALFGSKASGKDTPESDIDMLVLVKDVAMNFKNRILDLAFDVNLKHNVYISPRIISLSTFNDPVWSETPFIRGLKESGLSL